MDQNYNILWLPKFKFKVVWEVFIKLLIFIKLFGNDFIFTLKSQTFKIISVNLEHLVVQNLKKTFLDIVQY